MMQLKVMEPEKMIVDVQADKVIAEGQNGSFCLEPRHVDFVSVLKTGILLYTSGDQEHYVAVDEGVLVKCGRQVLVSVLNAIKGDTLEELKQRILKEFKKTEAMNQASKIALKSMEADLLLRFMEFEKHQ
jgi:F-type H+-transporting ATPase subunit epsilon